MFKFEEIISLLKDIHAGSINRKKAIAQYQDIMWNAKYSDLSEEAADILEPLAGDLDYYYPNPPPEFNNVDLYGEEQLQKFITDVFNQLKSLGMDV